MPRSPVCVSRIHVPVSRKNSPHVQRLPSRLRKGTSRPPNDRTPSVTRFGCASVAAAARAETCGTDVARLGLLVVLSDAGRAVLAQGTHTALAAQLRRDLLPRLGERAFPRRIRFVRELPTDARGKTTAADVRAASGLVEGVQE